MFNCGEVGVELCLLECMLLLFFTDKFSAVSDSGDTGALLRSCAPHDSPDLRRGLA